MNVCIISESRRFKNALKSTDANTAFALRVYESYTPQNGVNVGARNSAAVSSGYLVMMLH